MLTEGATTAQLVRDVRPGHAGQPGAWPRRAWRPGDRVAFLDRNGIEYFEVFFGCALLGAVSVAVNWRLAPAEMAAIIEDAGRRGGLLRTRLRRRGQGDGTQVDLRAHVGPRSTGSPSGATRARRGQATDPGFEPAATTWSPSSTPRAPPACPRA